MELHRKVNWRISAIQNICCNVGRPTCQTFVFIFKVREVRRFKCILKLPFWACDTVCHISGWLNYLQMDGADEAMDTILMIIISCSTITAQTCELYSLSMPYNGRYCPGDGTVILRSVPHLCRSVCLQSPTCMAYNYNVSGRTCTRLRFPCPETFEHPVMEFVVFTQKPYKQCYTWVTYNVGDALDERMVSQVGRIICRIVRSGNDVVFHWHSWYKLCFAYLSSPFNSDQGYTCQRLRIMEGCTVYWFPYTVRDSYHPELSQQDKWRMEIRC